MWHHFQGQNAVIDTKYRQNFRARGGQTSPHTHPQNLSLHTSWRPLTCSRSRSARAVPGPRNMQHRSFKLPRPNRTNVVSGGCSLVWVEIPIRARGSAASHAVTIVRSFGFDVLAPARGPRFVRSIYVANIEPHAAARARAQRRGALRTRDTPRTARVREARPTRPPVDPVSLVAGLSHPNSRVSRSSLGSRISVFGSRLASPRRLAASQCTLVGPVVRNVLPNSGS